MRSEIAKKILSETPQEVRDKVRQHGNEIMNRDLEISYFILTKEQEEKYLKIGRSIELALWKQGNDEDFRAKKEKLKINSK